MKLDSVGAMNLPAAAAERPRVAPAAAVQVVDERQVKKALEAANKLVQSLGSSLRFSVDQETGKTLVQVFDAGTNQLIRQIPPEEMLAISRALDKLQGLLIRQRA